MNLANLTTFAKSLRSKNLSVMVAHVATFWSVRMALGGAEIVCPVGA